MAADLDARSIPLTLDARLQERTARILQAAARRGKAAAAVVLDVSSGEVLARAQAPDFDPSASGWRDALLAADPRFLGVYGPWPDKTGLRGVFQAGSVGKLYSGVVAAREGLAHRGRGCASRGVATFACTQRDAQGPLFTRPGWTRPVHDHPRDPMHGTLEITEALAVSCNVFFAQLGLSLGPEAFAAAWAEGLEMGWGKGLSAGAPGSRTLASTAFGQGSMALSVSQAARLVALLGDGGIYRRCPSTLELGAPCPAKTLVADEGAIETLLAGMRRVVDEGTARRLPALAGVRVFGKTGTADAVGLAEEAPFGIQPGDETAPPHSWFVALAEPASNDPCAARAPGRLAVAVVVARGGSGAGNAAPAALEILGAARELGWLGKEPR
jgi:cell division protein FtsI/penicillin-binding protein 2